MQCESYRFDYVERILLDKKDDVGYENVVDFAIGAEKVSQFSISQKIGPRSTDLKEKKVWSAIRLNHSFTQRVFRDLDYTIFVISLFEPSVKISVCVKLICEKVAFIFNN